MMHTMHNRMRGRMRVYDAQVFIRVLKSTVYLLQRDEFLDGSRYSSFGNQMLVVGNTFVNRRGVSSVDSQDNSSNDTDSTLKV